MATVLIIEDTDNATPLEIALSSLAGIQVKVLSNGRDALSLLRADPGEVAAIVTDLHLPLVDGFEIVDAVRSLDRYSKLPIIVVSGDNQPENFSRVRELGANACFSKPYSPAEVRRVLEDLLHAP